MQPSARHHTPKIAGLLYDALIRVVRITVPSVSLADEFPKQHSLKDRFSDLFELALGPWDRAPSLVYEKMIVLRCSEPGRRQGNANALGEIRSVVGGLSGVVDPGTLAQLVKR